MLQSMGLQRVGHHCVTEVNLTEVITYCGCDFHFPDD